MILHNIAIQSSKKRTQERTLRVLEELLSSGSILLGCCWDCEGWTEAERACVFAAALVRTAVAGDGVDVDVDGGPLAVVDAVVMPDEVTPTVVPWLCDAIVPISVERRIYLCVVVGFAGGRFAGAGGPLTRASSTSSALEAPGTGRDSRDGTREHRHWQPVGGPQCSPHRRPRDHRRPRRLRRILLVPRQVLRYLRVVVSRPASTNQRGGIRHGAAPLYSCPVSLLTNRAHKAQFTTRHGQRELDRPSSCRERRPDLESIPRLRLSIFDRSI